MSINFTVYNMSGRVVRHKTLVASGSISLKDACWWLVNVYARPLLDLCSPVVGSVSESLVVLDGPRPGTHDLIHREIEGMEVMPLPVAQSRQMLARYVFGLEEGHEADFSEFKDLLLVFAKAYGQEHPELFGRVPAIAGV